MPANWIPSAAVWSRPYPRRRHQDTEGCRTDGPDLDDDDELYQQPLFLERVRRLAAPIAIVLVALLVVTLGTPTPRRMAAVVVLVVIAVVISLRNRGPDDREYGPGSDA